jgi:hypothetical protein
MKKKRVPVQKIELSGREDPLRWQLDSLYPLKLASTLPTSDGSSVGIVSLRTIRRGICLFHGNTLNFAMRTSVIHFNILLLEPSTWLELMTPLQLLTSVFTGQYTKLAQVMFLGDKAAATWSWSLNSSVAQIKKSGAAPPSTHTPIMLWCLIVTAGTTLRGDWRCSRVRRMASSGMLRRVALFGGTWHFLHQGDKNRWTRYFLKNCVFWDVTPCGSCKNRRFGGT